MGCDLIDRNIEVRENEFGIRSYEHILILGTLMSRVCLWGTGLKKVGDEAQLLAVCQMLQACLPEVDITIFARDDGSTQSHYPAFEIIPTARLDLVVTRLRKADVFLIVGGPFMEVPAQGLACFLLVQIAKTFQRPVITIGTTVLPYTTQWGKWVFRHIFKRLDKINLREDLGQEVFRNLGILNGVSVYGDPRLLLQPADEVDTMDLLRREGIDPGKPIIGLTMRYMHDALPAWIKRSHGYTDQVVKNAYEVIGRTIDDLSQFAQLVLIPMHPTLHDDLMVTETIRQSMNTPNNLRVLKQSYRSQALLGIIQSCQLLIAGRLASAIFATATSTPMVGIAFEPRLSDHMSKIHCAQYLRDWKTLDYQDFSSLMHKVWSERNLMIQHMKNVAGPLKQEVWNVTEQIHGVVNSRGGGI